MIFSTGNSRAGTLGQGVLCNPGALWSKQGPRDRRETQPVETALKGHAEPPSVAVLRALSGAMF